MIAAATAATSAGMAATEAKNARRQEEKNRSEIEEERRRRDNLFNVRYHQDLTERTEVQNMLRELREEQEAQRSQNEAKSAVDGTSKEILLSMEGNLNKAYANAAAGIASNASLLKDGVLDKYDGSLGEYYDKQRAMNSKMGEIHQNISNQWANAGNNALQVAGAAAGMAAGAKMPEKNTPAADGGKGGSGIGPIKMKGGTQLNPDGSVSNPEYNPFDRLYQQNEDKWKAQLNPNWSKIYGYGGGLGIHKHTF